METLILGHMYYYKKELIRCSPIDVDLWYDKPFKCVDFWCDKNDADFVYNIFQSIDYRFVDDDFFEPIFTYNEKTGTRNIIYKGDNDEPKIIKYNDYWIWKFAEDNSYDTIIDCCGSIHWEKFRAHSYENKYKFQDKLLETILRVLKVNGKFYSHFGIYTKINETTLDFEPKELYGYKYI